MLPLALDAPHCVVDGGTPSAARGAGAGDAGGAPPDGEPKADSTPPPPVTSEDVWMWKGMGPNRIKKGQGDQHAEGSGKAAEQTLTTASAAAAHRRAPLRSRAATASTQVSITQDKTRHRGTEHRAQAGQ